MVTRIVESAGKEMTVETRLRAIVQRCLGGPGGDPDRHHMIAAAHAFLALRQLGLSTSEDDEDFLRNNNWEMDFIDLAERNVVI